MLIDGGYPGTPPLIMASIATLGFDVRDVRVLLNSDPHADHAGGLAALQRASGAELRASDASANALASGGHTRDCTSYSFGVREGERVLQAVSACSLVMLQAIRYPEQRADFERTVRVLRGLPADVWVTSHGRLWGRYRKVAARDTARSPIEPFIDPEGYRAYVDGGEARLRRGVVQ